MTRARPTYAELRDQNARLQHQVTELEDLVRGLTQQLAEVMRVSGQERLPPAQERGPGGAAGKNPAAGRGHNTPERPEKLR
jgi:hypothetical protein